MPFVLVVLSGERTGEEFPILEGHAITIGRDSANTICLPDHKLSRIHCQFEALKNRCQVVDLNSTNGTLVNGERVTDEVWIEPDDEIEVGMTRLRLNEVDVIEEAGRSAAARAAAKPAPDRDGIRCEECGRQIAKAELANGMTRHVGDRHYCSNCSVSFGAQTDTDGPQLEPVRTESQHLEPGQEIASVRIVSVIGDGRLGPLYKGEQINMGRIVALKILDVADEKWVRNYLKAIYASGQLVYPNIALIFDAGETSELHYIIREYIEGQSVQQRLQTQEPVPLAEAFTIISEVAYALEHAFERHIFHGGLSPSKIILGENDIVKVTGFGLPQTLPPNHPVTTDIWRLQSYMAPERLREEVTIDFAGDVYSLVAIFYHLLTGRSPFSGSTREKLEQRILKRAPRPISRYNPDLPPIAQKIINRGLSKDPRARYQLPREFLYDIEENLRREM